MRESLQSPGERLALVDQVRKIINRYLLRKATAIEEIQETAEQLGLPQDDETVALALEQIDATSEDTLGVEFEPDGYSDGEPPDFRPRIRIHEAGHIVAAHLLGLTVYAATIQEHRGQVNYGSLLDNLLRREKMRMVKLAGFAAEGLIAGVLAREDSQSDNIYFTEERFQRVLDLLRYHTALIEAVSLFIEEHGDTVTRADLYGKDGPLRQLPSI